jgi:phospholipase C
MIITWDDWGGWYDHVTPPTRPNGTHLSFRKPIIFVGAYVKKGPVVNGTQEAYVSHVQTEDASINKTIENLYHLGTLGVDDVDANDFSDVIMPAGSAPATFVPITSQEIPAVPAPSVVPTLPIDARPRKDGNPGMPSRRLFRIVPPNFARPVPGASPFNSEDDYYGKRSADY